ncbi:MAG: hypothetical protein OXE45_12910 [bacterium]|nr:hypothetical protein [bacterium]
MASSSKVAVTVTDPPPSATVSLAALVVKVKTVGCAAVTVAVTEATVSPLYCVSSLVAAWVIVDVPASTPVTVNFFATSQLAGVNVTAPDTVAFAVVPEVAVTTTFAVGFESKTTVYSAVAPSATDTDDLLTVTPWVSSSVIVNVTPVTVKPVPDADKMTVSLPSSKSSSVICTVPVAALSPAAISNAAGSV